MNTPKGKPNRTTTVEQKREVLRRLLITWISLPNLRLGQLLVSANGEQDIFYEEDFDLIKRVEELPKELNSY